MSESAEETLLTETARQQKRFAGIEKIVLTSSIKVRTSRGELVDIDLADLFEVFAVLLIDLEKMRGSNPNGVPPVKTKCI